MTESLKVVFAGTPDFSVAPLSQLHQWCRTNEHQVVGVLTQPDRPAGRGRSLRQSPVKVWAIEHDIPVAQPQTLKTEEGFEQFVQFDADLMVVVAYGLLLPSEVLDQPQFGCINVHASLLPRWRGAAPIQRAIAAGDAHSGVCVMQMDEGLDTGPVWSNQSLPLTAAETGGSLHDRLSELGADLLVRTLPMILAGNTQPQTQAVDGVTYAHKLSKAEARINWHQTAVEIERSIRAFNPWPIAHTRLDGRSIRIFAANCLQQNDHDQTPGTIIDIEDGLTVATADGLLNIQALQPAGSRVMPVSDFLNSNDCLNKVFLDE